MQTILEQMLSKYKTDTVDEKKNALKEIVQEVQALFQQNHV